MKEPLKHSHINPSSIEEDDYALQLLHMDEKEVDKKLEAIALKNTHYSIFRIHNSLPLKKITPDLSLINGSKLERGTADKTSRLFALIRGLFAGGSIASVRYALKNVRSSRVVFGFTGLLAVCFLMPAISLYVDVVADRSTGTVGEMVMANSGAQESISEDFSGTGVNKADKESLQQSQPNLPSKYSNEFISLPEHHPVFEKSTMTVAVDSCRQCHSDVFTGMQQQLL